MSFWNEVKASQIAGVVLDCIVNPNSTNVGKTATGGTPTDNATVINNMLANASATYPIKLILDGGTALSTSLTIPAAGHVWVDGIGWDSGIYILNGANADAINNTKHLPFDGGTLPSPIGQNIILSNFCVNGNRGDGTTGNSTSGNPRGVNGTYWYCNVNICGVDHVQIRNMYLYDSPTYGIRLNGCASFFIGANEIYNPRVSAVGGTFNCDCIHIDGPSIFGEIIGNKLYNNNSDDGIALNAPEGFAGNITDITIEGNTYGGCLTGMRCYGNTLVGVGQVTFGNNVGSVQNAVILFGAGISNAQDSCGQAINVSNCNFASSLYWLEIDGNVGDIRVSNCTWDAPVNNNPFIGGIFASTISNLSVVNCAIYRNTSGHAAGTVLLGATAALTVTRMTVDNFQIVNQAGQSYAAISSLFLMTNVTISSLYIVSLDYTLITALTDTYTGITKLTGAFQPPTQIQSKTGAYTILPTDRTVLGDTTSAGFAVTLPATAYAGQMHTIKNIGSANTLTITGTVDGSANPTLTTLQFMTILYNGTVWEKVG